MLGGIVKGIGRGVGSAVKGIAGAVADTAGLSDFTSALGMGADKLTDEPKAAKVKAFDEDEAPTKVLQRILTEVQTIHKVMASQIVPPSEEEEIQRDKDKKDQEVLDALGDLGPKEDKKKKKKTPWWKMLWAWISPFIKWITKPLSWIKSLLKLPFFIGLARFAFLLGRFLLFNPIGIALLTIGIIAINWKDIKKAIKKYVGNIKGWVKKALISIGLGSWIESAEETEARKAEERAAALASQIEHVETSDELATTVPLDDTGGTPVIDADDDGIPDIPSEWIDTTPVNAGRGEMYESTQPKDNTTDGTAFAGWFKGGGKIAEGKEGLVHPKETVRGQGESRGRIVGQEELVRGPATVTRAKPESVGGQMLEGPSLVEGPARVRREPPVGNGVQYGSAAHKQMMLDDPTAGATASQRQTEMDMAGRGKGGALERVAAQRTATRDMFIGSAVGGAEQLHSFFRAIWDRRNVTKQAQGAMMQDPTQGQAGGKIVGGISKVGWDAEQLQKMIKGRGKGRGGEEYSPKQVKFYMAVADFGIDFAALRDISNERIRKLGTLQDAAGVDRGENPNWAITVLNAMRQNLAGQDVSESIAGSARMIAARMQNLPSINDTTLQQAGQPTTVSVVNQSSTQNISTASSSSKQNSVGQTQQSISTTDMHTTAPRTV